MDTIRRSPLRPQWLVGALAVAALSACHAPPPPSSRAPPVVTYRVHSGGDAERSLRYPIEVAPRYSTALSFRVPGLVIERRVRLGDAVAAGQTLARLDSVDAERQAASARATLAAAEHRLSYAQRQLDRDQAQSARQLIAANQLEQTQDAYASALAARDQAAAQAVVAENALRYHALVAEHAGIITSEDADTGEVVAAGQPIYQLAWSDEMDVVLDAAARDVGRFAAGQNASVSFTALGSQSFAARVREIAPAADAQSRTYRVKLTLAHPAPSVKLGMTGEARLMPIDTAQAADALTVPATALFHQGASPAVWVIDGTPPRLTLRAVSVSRYLERTVVVDGGLRDGERIVAAGVHTVHAGEPVTPVEPLYPERP
jgi:RND family efflux transporter MFP subunit